MAPKLLDHIHHAPFNALALVTEHDLPLGEVALGVIAQLRPPNCPTTSTARRSTHSRSSPGTTCSSAKSNSV